MPCAPTGYQCTKVDVPLDRSGEQPGTVGISAVRVRASSNPSNEAVVALAGGPGQAAIPIAQAFAKDLGPAIVNRDLLVFDQRGTGNSNPLRCSALATANSLTAACATAPTSSGPARGFFRSVDSVADIEALRADVGLRQARALRRLLRHEGRARLRRGVPQTVSPRSCSIPSSRPAVPTRCSARRSARSSACWRTSAPGANAARATSNVVSDVRKLAAKLARKPLRGPVISPRGRRFTATLGETGLWNVLVGGDLNPTLRAELPGSVRAALTGDVKPILRLSVRAQGLQNLQADAGGDNDVVFFTTTCEESATIPWTRGASESQRSAEVQAAARALPAAVTDPFSWRPALGGRSHGSAWATRSPARCRRSSTRCPPSRR